MPFLMVIVVFGGMSCTMLWANRIFKDYVFCCFSLESLRISVFRQKEGRHLKQEGEGEG
jgi:hypothetical protein